MGNFDIILPGQLPMTNSIPKGLLTKLFDIPSLKARGQISSRKTAKSNNYESHSFQSSSLSSKECGTKSTSSRILEYLEKEKEKL